MNRNAPVVSFKKKLRTSAVASLSFCVAFSGFPIGTGIPGFGPVAAQAAGESIVRISEAGAGIRRRLKLGLNKAIVVDLPKDAHDILVADPSMADAVTRTSRRIYLFGKAVGQTNIFVFGQNGEEIVSLDLEIERDIAGLEQNLRRFLPDSNIKVEIISDNIVLTGSVRTPQDSAKAVQLAGIFLKGGEATTRSETVQGTNGGDAAIYAENRQTSQIQNMLTVEGEDQVMLKITVAEIRREVVKQLGFDNAFARNASASGSNLNVLEAITDADGIQATGVGNIGKLSIRMVLSALEQANAIRTLAEPTLTAISGQSATFNSGGEILYSTVGPDGVTTVTPYKYGIGLAFTPTVLSSGRISLRIQTTVSEPLEDRSGVGEFRKRDAETVVELPSGGSMTLAGLIRDDSQQTMSGTPGASKIPVLGAAFRRKTSDRRETELVIIATPYLVRPTARNDLSRPDDNFNPASDAASVFLGHVNKIYGRREAAPPSAPYHGNVGFIYK
ncbi:pilus assembly protein CpaC [Neorhizobium huautlense]|uniref:Pilus assembly protein CpaC n=1 Tax=Neorhizobium huautlense TaxID=67774 RepID=A0ABT9PXD9_9HYPH|nr:type II and III secretion system protein family protein [Neorhizobium huautlense]MDP9838549.1 pilus assembly protein CpaC [Neorhizobium huautlense]